MRVTRFCVRVSGVGFNPGHIAEYFSESLGNQILKHSIVLLLLRAIGFRFSIFFVFESFLSFIIFCKNIFASARVSPVRYVCAASWPDEPVHPVILASLLYETLTGPFNPVLYNTVCVSLCGYCWRVNIDCNNKPTNTHKRDTP